MIEYLSSNLWLIWTIIALICLILELSSGDFYVTCFAIGALCSVVVSLFPSPIWLQVLVFAIASVLSILFIRPSLLKHLHAKGHERVSNADALIGRTGLVIEQINGEEPGYVKIDGDEWRAVCKSGDLINKGEQVKVIGRDSIIISVEKI